MNSKLIISLISFLVLFSAINDSFAGPVGTAEDDYYDDECAEEDDGDTKIDIQLQVPVKVSQVIAEEDGSKLKFGGGKVYLPNSLKHDKEYDGKYNHHFVKAVAHDDGVIKVHHESNHGDIKGHHGVIKGHHGVIKVHHDGVHESYHGDIKGHHGASKGHHVVLKGHYKEGVHDGHQGGGHDV